MGPPAEADSTIAKIRSDSKKGSLKQTTGRFHRAHETLRDFTQITLKWELRPWLAGNQITGKI